MVEDKELKEEIEIILTIAKQEALYRNKQITFYL
jgi:hypothetical protein